MAVVTEADTEEVSAFIAVALVFTEAKRLSIGERESFIAADIVMVLFYTTPFIVGAAVV